MPSEPALNLEDEADLMDAYIAGLLDDRQRQQFEQRMARDAALRRRVDEARSTANLVSDAYRFVTPGAHFESALTTRITQMVPEMEDLPLVDTGPQVPAKSKMILAIAIAVVIVMAAIAAYVIFL